MQESWHTDFAGTAFFHLSTDNILTLCRPIALGFVLSTVVIKSKWIRYVFLQALNFYNLASPLPNCHAAILGSTCLSMLATGSSSFLFLVRIQAVYSHSKPVKYAFLLLWLVQVGLSALTPLSVSDFFGLSTIWEFIITDITLI